MAKSLKLKLLDPIEFIVPKDGKDAGTSEQKPWPKRASDGCRAASGDECSIVDREVFWRSMQKQL
jgi:hypothetical protein